MHPTARSILSICQIVKRLHRIVVSLTLFVEIQLFLTFRTLAGHIRHVDDPVAHPNSNRDRRLDGKHILSLTLAPRLSPSKSMIHSSSKTSRIFRRMPAKPGPRR